MQTMHNFERGMATVCLLYRYEWLMQSCMFLDRSIRFTVIV